MNWSQRIKNLDFIRGCLILLMLIQHFVGLMANSHFDPKFFSYFFNTVYKIAPTYNFSTPLPYDGIVHGIVSCTVFWVTHFFLLLSSFSLGLKINEPKWSLKKYLKKLLIILILVTVEEYIVELDWSPVQVWCVCLAILSISYHFKKIVGLIFSLALVMSLYFYPSLDLVINNFYLTGFMGVTAAVLFKTGKYDYLLNPKVIISLIASSYIFSTLASPIELDPHDIYLSGVNYCKNPMNLPFIISLCLSILTAALYLEKKNIFINFRWIRFISVNSLPIYLSHKIAIVYFFTPLFCWAIINFKLNPFLLTESSTVFLGIVVFLITYKYVLKLTYAVQAKVFSK